jgi:hypothetical protein
LIQGFFSDYFGLGIINYACDFLLLICLLIELLNRKFLVHTNHGKKSWLINGTIICFGVVILLGWVIQGVSPLLAMWGVRNYGRFFLFYYLCKKTFSQSNYQKIVSWLIKLFPIHFLIVAYQIFVEHLSYDFLGGIFGKYQGCASGLMIYYGLVIIILFTQYDRKEIKFHTMLVYLAIILCTAAIAELKALFLYFIVMLAFYGLISRDKIKAACVLAFGVVGVLFALQILIKYFPQYSNFFNVDKIIAVLMDKDASYTYREGLDIGRSSVFSKLEPIIIQWGGNVARWFGLGLGNGEFSGSFNFLNSDFFNAYPKSNYNYFSLSFLFVETGYIGTIAYVAFFCMNELIALKNYLKTKNATTLMGVFLPLMCFFLLYYNSSLRTNFAYIVFALLASILNKGDKEVECQ